MITVNTAFWLRCQQDDVPMTDLMDLELPGGQTYHWTSSNKPLWYTRSGQLTQYDPFAGKGGGDFAEGTKLAVQVINIVLANSGTVIQRQLLSQDFAQAKLWWGQVFIDTPDLGRNPIYFGKVGDFAYDRNEIAAQARNFWKSLNIQWPPYNYNDRCALRFGGPVCGITVGSYTVTINSINVGSSTQLNLLVKSGTVSASYSPGRFNFGKLTVTAGVNSGHSRPIMAQSGDLFTLAYPLPDPDLTGMQVSIYPGCNKRLIEDCTSLYNNNVKYLGFPWTVKEGDAF